MNLNTGLDVSGNPESIPQMNILNNEGAITAYYELSTGVSGCPILTNNGQLIENSANSVLVSLLSGTNANLKPGFYHFLYDPNSFSNPPEPIFSLQEQGRIFALSLLNSNIPNTYYPLVVDIEWATFNGNCPSADYIISCLNEFLEGLNATMSGNFEIMLYMPYDFINASSLYDSDLTNYLLWMNHDLTTMSGYENIYMTPSYQLNNSEIEAGMSLMNSVNWGGVQGWSGWQYATSGQGDLYVDLDIFNMDVVENPNMSYSAQ